ncbi:MAG: glycosyltransferase family 2 protein [Chitinophagales bacterium]
MDSRAAFTVVIPAFNEARRIRRVIEVARRCPGVAEVLVVDDGSQDQTARVAELAGARVVRFPENRGKGAAMLAGAEAAGSEVLLFLDADLLGLTAAHLQALAGPVLAGDADMTMGLFESGRISTDLAQKLTPFLTGQRAMRRATFLAVPGVADAGFGVEVAISHYAKEANLRVTKVTLSGVSQVMKEEKRGFRAGFRSRLRMYWELVRSWVHLSLG